MEAEVLLVKDFGNLKRVSLELKPLTVLVGEANVGKSSIAKLIAIFRSKDFWIELSSSTDKKETVFKKVLSHYGLENYLSSDTIISYFNNTVSEEHAVAFLYIAKNNICYSNFEEVCARIREVKNPSYINIVSVAGVLFNKSIYAPTNRNLASFISSENSNLFPKLLIDYINYFKEAGKEVGIQEIDFLNLAYKNEYGKDYIITNKGKNILLSKASSSAQAIVPLLAILTHYNSMYMCNFTIEEPEMNLFPSAQKDLVEFFADKVLGCKHNLVITTHSPYILTSLNNLLFASTVSTEFPELKKNVAEILGFNNVISASNVIVYYLNKQEDEIERPICLIKETTGMISSSNLDDVSDDIADVFDVLLGLYGKFKRQLENAEEITGGTTETIKENNVDNVSKKILDTFYKLLNIYDEQSPEKIEDISSENQSIKTEKIDEVSDKIQDTFDRILNILTEAERKANKV